MSNPIRQVEQRASLRRGQGRSLGRTLPRPLPQAELQHVNVDGHAIALHLSRHSNLTHTPLVLVHSVSAASSAIEFRALWNILRHETTVMAIELPGFGHSARADRAYTPALMAEAVAAGLLRLKGLGYVAAPDVVALSLACEFTTLAALDHQAQMRSLTLISPTGAETRRSSETWASGRVRGAEPLRKLLRWAPLGAPLFKLLTTRPAIRWFLSRAWGTPRIDRFQLEHGWRAAQVGGARHAPLDFVAGALFSKGISQRYRQLPMPVWLAHGRHGAFTDFGALGELPKAAAGRWCSTVFDTGALPQAQQPEHFAEQLRRFIADGTPRSTVGSLSLQASQAAQPPRC